MSFFFFLSRSAYLKYLSVFTKRLKDWINQYNIYYIFKDSSKPCLRAKTWFKGSIITLRPCLFPEKVSWERGSRHPRLQAKSTLGSVHIRKKLSSPFRPSNELTAALAHALIVSPWPSLTRLGESKCLYGENLARQGGWSRHRKRVTRLVGSRFKPSQPFVCKKICWRKLCFLLRKLQFVSNRYAGRFVS